MSLFSEIEAEIKHKELLDQSRMNQGHNTEHGG